MDANTQQKIASLTRPQINQLCLGMQTMITNLKTFLSQTHGYSDQAIVQIANGVQFENISNSKHSALDKPDPNVGTTRMAESFTHPNPQDILRLKREDESIRRSMMFELEWCQQQIESGNFPH